MTITQIAEIRAELDEELSGSYLLSILETAKEVTDVLQEHLFVWQVVGSVRRGEPAPNDIDILVSVPEGNKSQSIRKSILLGIAEKLGDDPEDAVITNSRIIFTRKGIQVDLIFSYPSEWGLYVVNFTGPRKFNQLLIERAKKRGHKIHHERERGLTFVGEIKRDGYVRVSISHTKNKSEQEVLEMFGLEDYLDPRLRNIFS